MPLHNNIVNIYSEKDIMAAKEEDRGLSSNTLRIGARTEIQQFYKDQCIFITGGTGFLGKVLIEKLLRSCEDVRAIYVLVRNKKGKDPASRVQQLLNDVLFKTVLEKNPKGIHKVLPIEGDLRLPALGINPEDRKYLINNVTVVINMAATVRFNEKLSVATVINVTGTKEMLVLAKECKNLKAFTHVSTAFSNTQENHIEEKIYEPPMPVEALEGISQINEQLLESITPTLLGNRPNTYCFTKAIAEEVVRKYGEGMPISVVRPSIVIATYKEPVCGWSDNIYGPNGIVVGAGIGVIRTIYLDLDKVADIVPADMTINAILAATYHTAKNFKQHEPSHIPVYNFVSGTQNPIKWRQFTDLYKKYGMDRPVTKALWYYGFNPTNNYYLFLFYNFFLHYLPALLIDVFSALIGRPRTMLKMYASLSKFRLILVGFGVQDWNFSDTGVQNMWKSLSEADRTVFPFDIRDICWEQLMEIFIEGVRVYIVKEDSSTLPEARKKWNRLFYLHQLLKLTTLGLILIIFYMIVKPIFKPSFNMIML